MHRLARLRSEFERKRLSFSLTLDRLRGKRVVHLLHIGKTGGTAVIASLEAAEPERFRLVLTGGHAKTLADVPCGDAVIFFVRDPVSRFISGFNSRLREGRPRYHYRHSAGERVAFERFPTPNALAMALSDPQQRAAAEQGMRSIQHVRDSLWYWFGDESALRERLDDILFVGSQEHLARDFGQLAEILGLDVPLVTGEVASHRNPAGMSKQLEAGARRNLRNWYTREYDCLELLRSRFPHLADEKRIEVPPRKAFA